LSKNRVRRRRFGATPSTHRPCHRHHQTHGRRAHHGPDARPVAHPHRPGIRSGPLAARSSPIHRQLHPPLLLPPGRQVHDCRRPGCAHRPHPRPGPHAHLVFPSGEPHLSLPKTPSRSTDGRDGPLWTRERRIESGFRSSAACQTGVERAARQMAGSRSRRTRPLPRSAHDDAKDCAPIFTRSAGSDGVTRRRGAPLRPRLGPAPPPHAGSARCRRATGVAGPAAAAPCGAAGPITEMTNHGSWEPLPRGDPALVGQGFPLGFVTA
jgi:hypothetical protein